MQESGAQDSLVLSYLTLRKAVGFIGLGLPVVLAVGKILFQGPGLQETISDYYHTDMRNILVGVLCAIGVFFLSYRGYDRRDRIAGGLASGLAIGVALFPATPFFDPITWIGVVHVVFSISLFLTLAYFSFFLFTETDSTKVPTPQKLKRNVIYRASGCVIFACIVLAVLTELPALYPLAVRFDLRFWLESVIIIAFGVSWLTKGEWILKDEESHAEQVSGMAAGKK